MKILKTIYSFLFTEQEFYYLFRFFLYFQNKSNFFSDFFRKLMIVRYGVYIGKKSIVDKSVVFPHPSNIVIGEGVIIEKNVVIYQGVTLGLLNRDRTSDICSSYPHIMNDVYIYANSTLVGGITVSAHSIIGANSFISKDVPKNSISYGSNYLKKR